MPNPVPVDIAQAVADELNGGTFSQSFTAVRAYVRDLDLQDLATLQVTVFPIATTPFTLSRGHKRHDYTIGVAVLKMLNGKTTDLVDPFMLLLEEIVNFFFCVGTEPLAGLGFHCTGAQAAPMSDQGYLDEKGTFNGLVTLTYQTYRSPSAGAYA